MSTNTNTFATKSIAKMRQLWGGLALTALFALTNTAQADVVWGTAPPSDSDITWTDYTFSYTPKNKNENGTTLTLHASDGATFEYAADTDKKRDALILIPVVGKLDVIKFIVPDAVEGQYRAAFFEENNSVAEAGFVWQKPGLHLIADADDYDLNNLPAATTVPNKYTPKGINRILPDTYYLSSLEDFELLLLEINTNSWGGELVISFGAYATSGSDAGDDGDAGDAGNDDTASTPEPATMLILGLGLAGLALVRRRK